MEPKIYKMANLGHLSQTGIDHCIEETLSEINHRKKKDATRANLLLLDNQLKILKSIRQTISESMAFDLLDVKRAVAVYDVFGGGIKIKYNTMDSLTKQPMYYPYDKIWLENYSDFSLHPESIADLFVRIGNVDTDDFLAVLKEYKTERVLGIDRNKLNKAEIDIWHKLSFMNAGGFVALASSICFVTINKLLVVYCPSDNENHCLPAVFIPNEKELIGRLEQGQVDDLLNTSIVEISAFARFCDFLSIKNIHCLTVPFSLKQRHKRLIKKGLRYHTLVVSKPGKQYDSTGGGDEAGTMPLHICRGHVKRYTEERPLFGKYSGTFYIPAHTRGKMENGIVTKDYSLQGV